MTGNFDLTANPRAMTTMAVSLTISRLAEPTTLFHEILNIFTYILKVRKTYTIF